MSRLANTPSQIVGASGRGHAAALFADQDGAAAVEFALLLPTLVLFMIGVLDLGWLVYEQTQVTAAAQVGAMYALRNGGGNLTAIQNAVVNSTSLTVTATPAPQLLTACVVSGAVTVTAASTCPGGGTPGSYVQVNAQASVSPLIVWSNIALPSTLSAQAMVRIN